MGYEGSCGGAVVVYVTVRTRHDIDGCICSPHFSMQAIDLPPLYWWPLAAAPSAASTAAPATPSTAAADSDGRPLHILLACQHLTRLELVNVTLLPSLQVS